MTSNDNLTIANTILAQLGGNKFLAMTGAKNLLAGDHSLSMKLGRGAKNGITHLTVELNGFDTYTVKFQRVHGYKVTEKGTTEGVYVSELQDVFTRATGFDTHL